MDDTPFLPMVGAFDTAIVWDYADLGTPLPFLEGGRRVELIAWSMGVWAATQTLSRARLSSAVAANGTPWPIDDVRGIPCAVFDATLAGFSEAGLTRFRRRMCGGAAGLAAFMTNAPKRGMEDLRAELAALGEGIRARPPRPFAWSRALTCAGDRIFPPEAQRAAFPEAESRPGAHWAPELFAALLRGEPA